MTTVYRNAASVAEARVLELTAQWENTLKSKDAASKAEKNEKKDKNDSTADKNDGTESNKSQPDEEEKNRRFIDLSRPEGERKGSSE